MGSYIRILRPKQWVKNLLVFCPLFFSGNFFNWPLFVDAAWAFLVFSLAASGIYCFNDACDAESDRRHPVKCSRPVASGAVSVPAAYVMAALLCVVSVAASVLLLSSGYAALIAGYVFLNLLYSLWLKKIALLDVVVLASFYVMRLFAGDIATGCHLSHWIIIVTFVGAFMLGIGKRRAELAVVMERGIATRRNLMGYNLQFIDMALVLSAGATFMCYVMYTVAPHPAAGVECGNLFWTAIILFVAILRYLQIAIVGKQGEDPSELFFKDLPLGLLFVAWAFMFAMILYF